MESGVGYKVKLRPDFLNGFGSALDCSSVKLLNFLVDKQLET